MQSRWHHPHPLCSIGKESLLYLFALVRQCNRSNNYNRSKASVLGYETHMRKSLEMVIILKKGHLGDRARERPQTPVECAMTIGMDPYGV